MCGIFGIVVNEASAVGAQALERDIGLLLRLSEPRGREATGLAVKSNNELAVFRRAQSPSGVLRNADFSRFLRDALGPGDPHTPSISGSKGIIGHCRLVTNGRLTADDVNQPIVKGRTVGVHNGVITNDQDLSVRLDNSNGWDGLDSTQLFQLLDKEIEKTGDIVEGAQNSFSAIEGSASIAALRSDLDLLILGTNVGSVFFLDFNLPSTFIFASERAILQKYIRHSVICRNNRPKSIQQLRAGAGAVISFDKLIPNIYSLIASVKSDPIYVSKLEVVNNIRVARKTPTDMKRCARCVLPESYPFIEFDLTGICNYCRAFKPQRFLGSEKLRRVLDRYRRTDGNPDCIVAFSGGRDSSYGLHLLKTEFDMNPIAFTYDWGLVTDIARRNQARMCGELGIEHLIRADDISKKRRYIRMNVEAWLKRPHLGMVPLFMAGDKLFLQHARKLRRETRIPLMIFCSGNELERCEFKIGFCGIKDTALHEVFYRYPTLHKIRLALWYSKQYMFNPRYINESIVDSLAAFYAAFIGKDDFLQLYHYVAWDEEQINTTLINSYGWESAVESSNTWRIGDGYTSFINYIYYTVAGFSEYDTFRSNQVRSNFLDRSEALKLAAEDNEIRYKALQEFSNQVGINLDATLLRINEIPKLY